MLVAPSFDFAYMGCIAAALQDDTAAACLGEIVAASLDYIAAFQD